MFCSFKHTKSGKHKTWVSHSFVFSEDFYSSQSWNLWRCTDSHGATVRIFKKGDHWGKKLARTIKELGLLFKSHTELPLVMKQFLHTANFQYIFVCVTLVWNAHLDLLESIEWISWVIHLEPVRPILPKTA